MGNNQTDRYGCWATFDTATLVEVTLDSPGVAVCLRRTTLACLLTRGGATGPGGIGMPAHNAKSSCAPRLIETPAAKPENAAYFFLKATEEQMKNTAITPANSSQRGR